MSELKPCPCCGGEAGFVELDDGGIVAVCIGDGCVASGVSRYACGDEPRPLVAEAWNARAIPADHVLVPMELLEELLEAAKDGAAHKGEYLSKKYGEPELFAKFDTLLHP